MRRPRFLRPDDSSEERSFAPLIQWGVYVLVALVMMWPATFRMTEEFVGYRDANYYMWLSWRLGELIASFDIFSFSIPDIVHPFGVDLRLIDGQLPSLYGGVLNLFFGPFLAFNLTILTGTLLNMWAGGRLARAFTSDRFVCTIVGLAFATAPAIALRMIVHLPMYFAFTVPLLLAEAVRTAKGGEPLRPLRVGLLMFVAYLCSAYFFIFGAMAFVLFLLFGTIGTDRFKHAAMKTGIAFLIVGVLMSPFLVARLSRDRAERAAGGDPVLLADTYRAGGDALSVIAQPKGSTIDLPGAARLRENFRDDNVHESTVFPGFLMLAGFFALLWVRNRMSLALAGTAVIIWIFTLGSSLKIDGKFLLTSEGEPVPWMPYSFLLKLPGLGSLRSANRVSYTLAAVLAACLALSLGYLFTKLKGRGRLAAAAGCGLLLATNLLVPLQTSRLWVSAGIDAALREIDERSNEDDSVLLVPADCIGETVWDVRLQILHQTPAVGCQTSQSALPFYSEMDVYAESEELAALRCTQKTIGRRATEFDGDETFERSDIGPLNEELDVRFLVVDKTLLDLPGCQRLTSQALPELRKFEVLAEDSRWIVLDATSAL